MKIFPLHNSGQTLVVLLVFMAMLIVVTGGAVAVTVANTTATSKLALGEQAYHIAEAGAENAILRLLRNPQYAGETLSMGDGSAIVTVSGGAAKTITSVGVSGESMRTVRVSGTVSNTVFAVTGWQEID
jgi:hypothetical protein